MMSRRSGDLAVLGGPPVCRATWPIWPAAGPETLTVVTEILESGRWGVSGAWTGRRTKDSEFAERFAAFLGTNYCVPVDHGSSALLAALTALGVRPGDEVIVPGLTWVACASVVVRAGARPVLADIDAETLCVDAKAVEAAISPRTAAILAVHAYSTMADVDKLAAIAGRAGVPLVEDVAQAIGARWRDAAAGTFGTLATFSFQQNKVLTCGEGGAVVTADPQLHSVLERLRGDGRRYLPERRRIVGQTDLASTGGLQGWNMHLSELQAALLLDGLQRLPAENARRDHAAHLLDDALGSLNGYRLVRPYAATTQRSYFQYIVRIEPEAFAGRPIGVVSTAVSAELGCWVRPLGPPLNAHPLCQPHLHPLAAIEGLRGRLAMHRFELPVATHEAGRGMILAQPLLLAPAEQVHQIVEALEKVRRQADRLPCDDDDLRTPSLVSLRVPEGRL